MTTTNDHLQIYANTKLVLAFSVTDADNGGAELDLTGLSVVWTLSARVGKSYAATASLTKSTGGAGITITDAAAGTLEVALDPADTADLLGDFHQELEVIDGGGAGVVVAVGNVEILRNVSGP